MLPFYRLVEVAVYSLLNFLPFMLLALYPFRNTLRFSRTKTYFLIGIILLIQIGLGITAAFSEAADGLLSALSTIIYAMFFFLAIKSHFGQILFILLMLSNVANFVVMASKCLEGLIFGDIAYEAYRWTFSLMMAIVELIFLIPLFLYMRNTYTIIFEKKSARDTWRFLWLIPATFYFVWYFNLYSNEASGLEIALQPNKTLLLFIINLGAIFIFHIVVKHINFSVLLCYLLKSCLYRCLIRNICFYEPYVGKLTLKRFSCRFVHVEDNDIRTLSGKTPRACFPDSASSARYNRHAQKIDQPKYQKITLQK